MTTTKQMTLILIAALGLAMPAGAAPQEASSMQLTSPAFQAGSPIPKENAYKGEGQNVSPPLAWTGVPVTAKELALVCEDPDAPRSTPWVHWVLYRIPSGTNSIAAGSTPAGAAPGKNDFGETGWGGPFPPKGDKPHRYQFTLYALDMPVTLPDNATKADLATAVEGHILAEGRLEGTYQR